ncbi:MAG TPA: hypothetical protein VH186_23865 [Chloroflexia bacterium]|nr:hypothetical protein [Chloroflexia bacterium]
MDRQQAITSAFLCEVAGLLMMLFVNRLMPVPLDLVVTGLGFLLLLFGPFLLVFKRD